jgi:hypothetical protein
VSGSFLVVSFKSEQNLVVFGCCLFVLRVEPSFVVLTLSGSDVEVSIRS